MSLVLVRPAETEFSRRGRLQGQVDLPLTPEGRREVQSMVGDLEREAPDIAAYYSGSDLAARQTAEMLAKPASLRVRVLPALSGVSIGLWEGQLVADVRHRHTRMYEQWRRDPCSITPPEGERMGAAEERAASAVRLIRKKHRKGSVVVVASDWVRGLIWCLLNDLPAASLFEVCRGLSAVEVVESERVS
jgi:broad specificity phosphatase PhoE